MRGLVFIVIALFMVSCGSQGNYVTFKAPTFRQLANCEPWQQKMFTDFCEWKYYDSDVKTKLVFNKKGRKNLYQQHIMILGFPPDTTLTYNQYGSWMNKNRG